VNRVDLLHLIRAACDLLEVDEVVVLGSQAILATRSEDDLPYAATRSREADIAAWHDPDESLSHRLAGVLGEDSAFDHSHGYFVDGVSTMAEHPT
jgi:ribosome modulation factor